MKILIVGGGRASIAFMDLFAGDSSIRILGIVDPSPDAPGAAMARETGVPVADRIDNIPGAPSADVVIELTGVEKVRHLAWDFLTSQQDFMTAGAGKLIFDVLQRREAKQKQSLAADLDRIVRELRATVGQSACGMERLKGILREMRMLSVNASIEAARTGDAGAGFAVLSNRMRELVGDVEQAADGFGDQNEQSHHLLSDAQDVQARLTGRESPATASA
ncbi:MAG: hypothetical protein GVY16_08930 [Planctomycetes bacterium]|jgi:hypothetical protein|nr:hypothetical protein [Planctomycetota bacterium]